MIFKKRLFFAHITAFPFSSSENKKNHSVLQGKSPVGVSSYQKTAQARRQQQLKCDILGLPPSAAQRKIQAARAQVGSLLSAPHSPAK